MKYITFAENPERDGRTGGICRARITGNGIFFSRLGVDLGWKRREGGRVEIMISFDLQTVSLYSFFPSNFPISRSQTASSNLPNLPISELSEASAELEDRVMELRDVVCSSTAQVPLVGMIFVLI